MISYQQVLKSTVLTLNIQHYALTMGYQKQEADLRFGRELSRLRRLSGFTQDRLARSVECSQGHIGNLERGDRSPDLRLVAALDRELEAEGRLERLWSQLTNVREPAWLDDLANIEREAITLAESQIGVIPSLLQIREYAASVIRATSPWMTKGEIKESIDSRIERAERFTSSEYPTYRAVLDESIVRRHLDDREATAKQLSHLVDLIERDRISLQIVKAGCHPGQIGPFKLITSPAAPDVVYVESAHAGHIIDDSLQVHQFRLLLGDLQAIALSPPESLALVRAELEGLNHD
ncbi:helix-turn-helix transcriptional regulator [Lipingzhangella sp. LS1_29]|uniref:Helix-turn-helix transcriptional regulator n=1 Tax=Lipingzhangella rawalii TaxID=2055835 RepID=A0ABU2H934_9ACTN|nr:helix-turn-helix transcriptional regulator [Lipingzhangella rawalii]MDS1271801.1 helix-turn-helix transcriptional regulator [Lipingzhangella rawalii]